MGGFITLDLVARLSRTLLQVAGTAITTKGFMAEDQWTAISGALLVVITTGFTIYSSSKKTA